MGYLSRLLSIEADNLPYDSVVPDFLAKYYDASLRISTPLVFGLIYLFVVGYYNRRRPQKVNYLKGPLGTALILLRSLQKAQRRSYS